MADGGGGGPDGMVSDPDDSIWYWYEPPERPRRHRRAPTRLQLAELDNPAPTSPTAPAGGTEVGGTRLGDIPAVAERLNGRKISDETLQLCHSLCFGTPGSARSRRTNLLAFAGCPPEDESMILSRVEAAGTPSLAAAARCLGCAPAVRRRSFLIEALARFLRCPAAAPDEARGSQRRRASQRGDPGAPPAKRGRPLARPPSPLHEDLEPPRSAYFFFVLQQEPRVRRKYPTKTGEEVNKKVAERWSRMNDDDKTRYQARADRDVTRYEESRRNPVPQRGEPRQLNSDPGTEDRRGGDRGDVSDA